ncbi:TVP38/TMEM64 family protein [Halomicrobium katesii]|uniref:TVP38/TMEM64 family protein n=1 Tax=Halomicrobium katesii TaxID=437163 RepID=UPI0004756377|nr:VTT domain-containing protein [Halomicrobium katesii]
MKQSTRRQLGGVVAFAALVVVASLELSPRQLLDEVAHLSAHPLQFGAALLVLYLVRPLFAWPISPISALVGYVLGLRYGIPVALVGATLTTIPPFLFARYAGRSGGGLFARLNDAGRRFISVTGATRGVLAARLSPLPADPVSYGAGFSGVSTRAYVVGTFLGEIPWVFVEVLAGASMRTLSTEGLSAGLHVLLGSFAVAVVLLAGPAYRHVRSARPSRN